MVVEIALGVGFPLGLVGVKWLMKLPERQRRLKGDIEKIQERIKELQACLNNYNILQLAHHDILEKVKLELRIIRQKADGLLYLNQKYETASTMRRRIPCYPQDRYRVNKMQHRLAQIAKELETIPGVLYEDNEQQPCPTLKKTCNIYWCTRSDPLLIEKHEILARRLVMKRNLGMKNSKDSCSIVAGRTTNILQEVSGTISDKRMLTHTSIDNEISTIKEGVSGMFGESYSSSVVPENYAFPNATKPIATA